PALTLAKPHGFSYGLGWFIQDYQGQVVWMHTGSINGQSAIVGLLPDKRVGVFVLANLDHAEVRHALMYKVFDLYAGNRDRDWSKELYALFHPPRATTAATTQQATQAAPPSLSLDRYAGTYADSAYGVVEVSQANGTLRVRFRGEDVGTLEPLRFETFRLRGASPEDASSLTFVPDGVGGVTAVRAFG